MWSWLPDDVITSHIVPHLFVTSSRALSTTCRTEHRRVPGWSCATVVRIRTWARGVDWPIVGASLARFPATSNLSSNPLIGETLVLLHVDSSAFVRAILVGPHGPSSDWRWRNLYLTALVAGDPLRWLMHVLHTEARPPGTTIRRVLETSGMAVLRNMAHGYPRAPTEGDCPRLRRWSEVDMPLSSGWRRKARLYRWSKERRRETRVISGVALCEEREGDDV